jgi:hypothetical protein
LPEARAQSEIASHSGDAPVRDAALSLLHQLRQ